MYFCKLLTEESSNSAIWVREWFFLSSRRDRGSLKWIVQISEVWNDQEKFWLEITFSKWQQFLTFWRSDVTNSSLVVIFKKKKKIEMEKEQTYYHKKIWKIWKIFLKKILIFPTIRVWFSTNSRSLYSLVLLPKTIILANIAVKNRQK